jgi:hypothetical protein
MMDSFTIHRSYLNAMAFLPKGKHLAFLQMIISYGLDEKEPDPTDELMPMFQLIKPNMDESSRKRKYLSDSRKQKQIDEKQIPHAHDHAHDDAHVLALRKGIGIGIGSGKGSGSGEAGDTPLTPTLPLSLDTSKPETSGTKSKPRNVEEVAEYCAEKGLDVDAERFMDFYESKGWKVGKDTMKDWRAAVRNWARGNSDSGGRGQVKVGQAAAAVVPWDPSKRTLRELRPADAD